MDTGGAGSLYTPHPAGLGSYSKSCKILASTIARSVLLWSALEGVCCETDVRKGATLSALLPNQGPDILGKSFKLYYATATY